MRVFDRVGHHLGDDLGERQNVVALDDAVRLQVLAQRDGARQA